LLVEASLQSETLVEGLRYEQITRWKDEIKGLVGLGKVLVEIRLYIVL